MNDGSARAWQQKKADELLASLKQQNAACDEQARRMARLRQEFNLIDDETLQRIAEEQRKIHESAL